MSPEPNVLQDQILKLIESYRLVQVAPRSQLLKKDMCSHNLRCRWTAEIIVYFILTMTAIGSQGRCFTAFCVAVGPQL